LPTCWLRRGPRGQVLVRVVGEAASAPQVWNRVTSPSQLFGMHFLRANSLLQQAVTAKVRTKTAIHFWLWNCEDP